MTFGDRVRDFDDALKRRPDEGTFWELAPELFATVLREGLHIAALNGFLAGVRDRNMPVTANHPAGQFVALHMSPYSGWAIIFHQAPPTFLYLSPLDALQARIGGAELSVTRYSCPRPDSFDLLDRQLRLDPHSPQPAPLNAVFARHGCREILDWRSPAGSAHPGVTLRVNSGLRAEYEWAFDRETLQPIGLSAVDPVRSNLLTIFSLLASAGDDRSIPHLQPFLASDKHFVRWGAARAIAAIDRGEGMASLRALADDPHLEVRTAARTALETLASAA